MLRTLGLDSRVSQNAPKCSLASIKVHVAVSIPQEPPKTISWVLWHFCGVATIFRVYKGNSEKYKGKYAIGPFLLLFLVGRMNWLNSFTSLLHFYCCFDKHPYWPPLIPHSHMAIWPYDHILAIWPYSHMDIWHQMATIWVSSKQR